MTLRCKQERQMVQCMQNNVAALKLRFWSWIWRT